MSSVPTSRQAGAGTGTATGATPVGDPLLSIQDLRLQFATERGWVTVVEGVSFAVGRGETVGLVGESGSGKTVTGLSVMRLIPSPPGRVVGGSIHFEGEDLLTVSQSRMRDLRGDDIAMVFQEPMTSLNPAFTVGDQIAETVRRHRGWSRKKCWARAVEVLDLVGIPNAAGQAQSYPHQFSGGMRQRAMIAMAVCCDPKLIIADEPTTALDVTIQAQVLDLLLQMRAELGTAVLLITHDLGVVAEVCDRVVVMYAGQVVETADVDPLYDEPRHPYTEGLLKAMPQLGERTGQLASIPGVTPEPWAMPAGCRFNPRCPYCVEDCTKGESGQIPLLTVGERRASRCIRTDELTLQGAP